MEQNSKDKALWSWWGGRLKIKDFLLFDDLMIQLLDDEIDFRQKTNF